MLCKSCKRYHLLCIRAILIGWVATLLIGLQLIVSVFFLFSCSVCNNLFPQIRFCELTHQDILPSLSYCARSLTHGCGHIPQSSCALANSTKIFSHGLNSFCSKFSYFLNTLHHRWSQCYVPLNLSSRCSFNRKMCFNRLAENILMNRKNFTLQFAQCRRLRSCSFNFSIFSSLTVRSVSLVAPRYPVVAHIFEDNLCHSGDSCGPRLWRLAPFIQ